MFWRLQVPSALLIDVTPQASLFGVPGVRIKVTQSFPITAQSSVGSLVLFRASSTRPECAAELKFNGTNASLASDCPGHALPMVEAGNTTEIRGRIKDPGMNHRCVEDVFPALQSHLEGSAKTAPGLDNGWRVPLFMNAATLPAQLGVRCAGCNWRN